jgi:proteasome assembly chaperone (PAC2) family protein
MCEAVAMTELRWQRPVDLRRPLVIVALEGLFDAAGAATAAVDHLVRHYDAQPCADIDPEVFFDFTQARPVVRLADDGRRVIDWPVTTAHAAAVEGGAHDLVLVRGVEPHLRWRTFADALLELAQTTGAEMVITLGAMVGLAPHTRALGVVGSAADEAVADRLGLGRPSYEGPTGLVGALHTRLDDAGMPVVSLRVSVPHYVPNPPNPEATRSLLARLELVTGIVTEHGALDFAADDWRRRIDAVVSDDAELTAYVRRLETEVDRSEILPTGDDIAAELEAFLRDRRADD